MMTYTFYMASIKCEYKTLAQILKYSRYFNIYLLFTCSNSEMALSEQSVKFVQSKEQRQQNDAKAVSVYCHL